ncbi:MAG: hypothetical protein HQ567_20500 [Candidatus Nealsonbacteria bacterium]|nr:hypothetical protein [Candidatus Nealsonbacteria bacterium]
MLSFKTWLLLRESFDRAAYNSLFHQELEKLLPKIADPVHHRHAEMLRAFDFVGYIDAALRNAGFTDERDRQEELHNIVVKLLLARSGLFTGYTGQGGTLDRRFGRSVANAIKSILTNRWSRQRNFPSVPLDAASVPGRPEAQSDETVIAGFRRLLLQRLGQLALVIFDTRYGGGQTKSLVGSPAHGNPSRSLVKQIVRRVKDLAYEYAESLDDPVFLRQVRQAMERERATVNRRKVAMGRRRTVEPIG